MLKRTGNDYCLTAIRCGYLLNRGLPRASSVVPNIFFCGIHSIAAYRHLVRT